MFLKYLKPSIKHSLWVSGSPWVLMVGGHHSTFLHLYSSKQQKGRTSGIFHWCHTTWTEAPQKIRGVYLKCICMLGVKMFKCLILNSVNYDYLDMLKYHIYVLFIIYLFSLFVCLECCSMSEKGKGDTGFFFFFFNV